MAGRAKARPKAKRQKVSKRPAAPRRVRPVPEGYGSVTPHLIVRDAARVIDFYRQGLGAREVMRMAGPDGRVMHAEVRIGDSVVMLGDEPQMPGCRSPQSVGARTATLYLYVPDVDAAFRRALRAGGREVAPPADMFWGDRVGTVEDPSGHQWMLATHKEDLTPREIARRQQEAASGAAPREA
jgi:PhnB protein